MADQTQTTDAVILWCPFCGEEPEIAKHFKEEMWRLVHRCPAVGPITIDWRDSVASVIKDWNRRA